jgi:immune inhibitor A
VKAGFDVSLPGAGLLIWHIDEAQSTNTDENHYKVALMQADGKRDLELNVNRGDPGDAYPGSSGNKTFDSVSNPNSKSYGNVDSCVAVTGIGATGPVMTVQIQVACPGTGGRRRGKRKSVAKGSAKGKTIAKGKTVARAKAPAKRAAARKRR